LPKAKFFAERISSGTRQRKYLRVPDPEALGKEMPSAKQPLPNARHSAKVDRRQIFFFAEGWELGKFWPSAKVAGVTAR
jgi:hypothetical protein